MGTSIVDYNSLTSAVANWMRRSGNSDFTGNIPDFIAFTEEVLNFGDEDPEFRCPPLRVSQMEVLQTTVTILQSTNTVALPADYLALRRIYENTSPTFNAKNKLRYVTPNQMDEAFARFPPGPPEGWFTIINNTIILASNVNTTDTLIFSYFQKVPPLSSSNTVNWLVQARPSLYLWGAMFQAALFVGDDDDAMKWGRRFVSAVRALNGSDLKGKYSGDALQIRTDVGNP